MNLTRYALVLGMATALAVASQSHAQGSSPEGTWQFTIEGSDRGVAYLTFSNDFSVTGYGITRDALGAFDVGGTWGLDEKDNVVVGYTFFIPGGNQAGSIEGKIVGTGAFQGQSETTAGPLKFRAPAPAPAPDLAGTWVGELKAGGTKILETFTLTVNTNLPGWFDLTGAGVSEAGSFSVTGAVLVTSDNRAAATTINFFGDGTMESAFAGKLVKKGNKLVFTGKNTDRKAVQLRAERMVAPTAE